MNRPSPHIQRFISPLHKHKTHHVTDPRESSNHKPPNHKQLNRTARIAIDTRRFKHKSNGANSPTKSQRARKHKPTHYKKPPTPHLPLTQRKHLKNKDPNNNSSK